MNPPESSTSIPFEKAFARLEQILERMNSGAASLDESLRLYEEANQLILTCNRRLTEAERRIEVLMKQRNGDLQFNDQGQPIVEKFEK